MTRLRFIVPGPPVRWERTGPNRSTKAGVVHGERAVRSAAWRAVRDLGWSAMPDGPLSVAMDFVFPRPARRPSYVPPEVWATGARCRRPIAPDRDNLVKLVFDGMQPRRTNRQRVVEPGPLDDDKRCDIGHARGWIAAVDEDPHTVVTVEVVPWLWSDAVAAGRM